MANKIDIKIIPEEEIFKREKILSIEEIQTDKETIKNTVEPILNQIIEKCRFRADKGIIRKNEFCECIDTNIESWISMCCKGRTKRVFSKMKDILEEKKKAKEIIC